MPIGVKLLKYLKALFSPKNTETIVLKNFYIPSSFIRAAEETSVIKGEFIKSVWKDANRKSTKIIFEKCYSKDFKVDYLYFELKLLSLKESIKDEELFCIEVYGKKINPIRSTNRN